MHTYTLTVDANGHVTIPDTRPGDTVTIQVPARLTRATARTEEERAAVAAAIRANARKLQELLKDEPPFSIDDLYGEDGLPR